MEHNQVSVNTFNRRANEYQQKYMDFDFYHDTFNTLCELLEKEQTRVLELACGPGNITQYLLNKLPHLSILATDLAPNMVALAKQNNPTIEAQVLDSRNITSLNEKFDAIVSGFCTPYLPRQDVAQLIKDCRDMLTDNGLLYLSTMLGQQGEVVTQTSSKGDQVHIYYYSQAELEKMLEQSGFKVVKVYTKQYSEQSDIDLFIYAQAV